MGYYADDDDLFFVGVISDFSTKETAFISLCLIILVIGLVWYSSDTCADLCDPLPSETLNHSCYCVQEDGSLILED